MRSDESGPRDLGDRGGFASALFNGQFRADGFLPHAELPEAEPFAVDGGRRELDLAATCTRAVKSCLEAAVRHAVDHYENGRPMMDLEAIKQRIACLAAVAFAMEATTNQVAALLKRDGDENLSLECSIATGFALDALRRASYEATQIDNALGLSLLQLYERVTGVSGLNTVSDGVVKRSIAVEGMRGIGDQVEQVVSGLENPKTLLRAFWRLARTRLSSSSQPPVVPVETPLLRPMAIALARRVGQFGRTVERAMMVHRAAMADRQYVQERIGDAAISLFTSGATLARLDRACSLRRDTPSERTAAEFYLHLAGRRFDDAMIAVFRNDDRLMTETANEVAREWAGYRPL
jgi:acyl-CoA dehydrogenase family protein 9